MSFKKNLSTDCYVSVSVALLNFLIYYEPYDFKDLETSLEVAGSLTPTNIALSLY